MLSRNNKILIGCLALLLVMSVGYALFSDTITITGTATAKGEFDINATCQTGVPSELVSGVHYQFDDAVENGYKNDTCSFVDDEGTFNVEFEYPGALRYFTVKMTNTGTITAVMGEPTGKDVDACLDYDNSNSYEASECSSTNPDGNYLFSQIIMINGLEIVGVQENQGDIVSYDQITEELAAEFMDSNGNYILKPGNSVFFTIRTGVNSLLGSSSGGKFMMSSKATYLFPFTQITE